MRIHYKGFGYAIVNGKALFSGETREVPEGVARQLYEERRGDFDFEKDFSEDLQEQPDDELVIHNLDGSTTNVKPLQGWDPGDFNPEPPAELKTASDSGSGEDEYKIHLSGPLTLRFSAGAGLVSDEAFAGLVSEMLPPQEDERPEAQAPAVAQPKPPVKVKPERKSRK